MDLKLTNKTALVAGSTAGIGLAIAQSLANEGAHLYVNGRTEARVIAAASARSHSPAAKADGIVAAFSSSAGAAAVIAQLPTVDVLVNNVGIFEPKAFADIFPMQTGTGFCVQRDEWSATRTALSAGHAGEEPEPHSLHIKRISRAGSSGDSASGHDCEGPSCQSAWQLIAGTGDREQQSFGTN